MHLVLRRIVRCSPENCQMFSGELSDVLTRIAICPQRLGKFTSLQPNRAFPNSTNLKLPPPFHAARHPPRRLDARPPRLRPADRLSGQQGRRKARRMEAAQDRAAHHKRRRQIALARAEGSQHWVNHVNSNVGTNVAHPVPVLIHLVKMLILRQVHVVQVERQRV